MIQAGHAQFEQVINQLEKEKMLYEQMNADIETRLRRAEQMEPEPSYAGGAESEKADIIRKAKDEGAVLVRRMRRESEAVIKELKEQFNDQGIQKRQAAIQEARARIDEAAGKVRQGIVSVKAYRKSVD